MSEIFADLYNLYAEYNAQQQNIYKGSSKKKNHPKKSKYYIYLFLNNI